MATPAPYRRALFRRSQNSFWLQVFGSAQDLLPLVLFFFVLPESPRWLLKSGRPTAAEPILRKVAK